MDVNKRLELIQRNIQELVSEEELKELLKKKKTPTAYLGTAVTGRPHIGYFPWVLKLSDLIKAGFKVKVLLADLHGALDGTPWSVLDKRYKYYQKVIPLMFKCVGTDLEKLEIVRGSSFQLKKEYSLDILKIATYATINDCKRSAAEVVKFGDNPKLAGIIYPIMQSLDEVYLDADMQVGGVDQRKILMFAREYLPKINQKPRIELMLPMIPGLVGKKMSASDPRSKIDLLDDEKTVTDKISNAYCLPGELEDNGLLAFLKNVIMVIKRDKKENFVIERPEKYGGNLSFSNYEDLEKEYLAKRIHPLDLKNAVSKEINKLLKPFRSKAAEIEKIAKEAY